MVRQNIYKKRTGFFKIVKLYFKIVELLARTWTKIEDELRILNTFSKSTTVQKMSFSKQYCCYDDLVDSKFVFLLNWNTTSVSQSFSFLQSWTKIYEKNLKIPLSHLFQCWIHVWTCLNIEKGGKGLILCWIKVLHLLHVCLSQ